MIASEFSALIGSLRLYWLWVVFIRGGLPAERALSSEDFGAPDVWAPRVSS